MPPLAVQAAELSENEARDIGEPAVLGTLRKSIVVDRVVLDRAG
jgi:hypothetical protein